MLKNRWYILFCAAIVIGSTSGVNIWSIFRNPLIQEIGATPSSAALPYSVFLIVLGLTSPFGGKLMDKIGAKKVLALGVTLWSLGWFMSGFATSVPMLVFTFGLLAGIGDGFIYTNIVVNALKWFPDRKGFVSGLIVGAAGLGPLIFAPLGYYIISQFNVMMAFKVMGVIFFVLMMIFALQVTSPALGYKPEGWNPPEIDPVQKTKMVEKSPKELIRDPLFYFLWIAFAFGTAAGAMMVAHASAIAQVQTGITAAAATAIVSIFSIFNSGGRLFWGTLSDRIGRYYTMMAVYTVAAVAVLSLTRVSTTGSFTACVAVIATCWGGTLAIFPTITTELWGAKNSGVNYGLMFLGYSMGGFLGPRVAGQSVEMTGSYNVAYTISTVMLVVGLVIFIGVTTQLRKRFVKGSLSGK